jgi:Fe2+ or Zn2+ uptake regulation protein
MHDWYVLDTSHIYSDKDPEKPWTRIHHMYCKKCGKFKKIEL